MTIVHNDVRRGKLHDLIREAHAMGDAVILTDHNVARAVSYHSLQLEQGTEWEWSQKLPDLLVKAYEAHRSSVSLICEVEEGGGIAVRLWFPAWQESRPE